MTMTYSAVGGSSTVTTVRLDNICQWCGCWHSGVCGRVKSIEYHSNGTVKRVEFHDVRPSPGSLGMPWYMGFTN